MLQNLKRRVAIFVTLLVILMPSVGLMPVAVSAAPANDPYKVDVTGLPNQDAADKNKGKAHLTALFSIVFGIIGALSVLFITIGGFRYVASQGDPQAAARAKGTIIYAIIGLIVSISAVAITTFILGSV